jgi:hypothetical protein
MIKYIDMQLSIWGKWAVRRITDGIGYPSVSPMFSQAQHGGSYGSREPIGVCEYVDDTDQAVARLDEDGRRLCVMFYQNRMGATEIARSLGIARQRFYDRLHRIHQEVMGHLNDIAAGV